MNEFFPAAVSLLVLGGAFLFAFLSEVRTDRRFRAFRPYPHETHPGSPADKAGQPYQA